MTEVDLELLTSIQIFVMLRQLINAWKIMMKTENLYIFFVLIKNFCGLEVSQNLSTDISKCVKSDDVNADFIKNYNGNWLFYENRLEIT